jgi:hypothetical protein
MDTRVSGSGRGCGVVRIRMVGSVHFAVLKQRFRVQFDVWRDWGASRYISVGFLPQSFVFTRLVTSWLLWPYLSALCIDSAGLYGALQGFTQKEAESMSILLHRLSRNGLQRSDPRTIAYESSTEYACGNFGRVASNATFATAQWTGA